MQLFFVFDSLLYPPIALKLWFSFSVLVTSMKSTHLVFPSLVTGSITWLWFGPSPFLLPDGVRSTHVFSHQVTQFFAILTPSNSVFRYGDYALVLPL